LSLLHNSEAYILKKKNDNLQERIKQMEASLVNERQSKIKSEMKLTHNAVTGIPNSRMAQKEIERLLNSSQDKKGIAFFALNDFYRLLKKTFSTKIPEWILYQTSLRLQNEIGDQGKVFHTREEEFLVIFTKMESKASMLVKVQKIIEVLEENHVMGGFTISLGVSCGMSFYPEHGDSKSEILRSADIALTEAQDRRVSVCFFEPALKTAMVERMEIQHGIHQALSAGGAHQEFQLYLQPQVKVTSFKMGEEKFEYVGAEGLIRWNHPTLGFISPGRFIPVAEQTGLIIPLTKWILHKAVRILGGWKARGRTDLTLSINLSTHQFNGTQIAEDIIDLVDRSEIPPHMLKLEITESGIMDNYKTAIQNLQTLQEAGFKILLDDFGTGYSSLSYLKRLPINIIKIDKSFVDSIIEDSSDQSLVKAIVQVAKDLGKGIIVEGVENRTQLDWLLFSRL
jgi:diguanylate cyclase (GGDEF)-like protein